MPLLGVNIDHVATLRQARQETEPDPVKAAQICIKSGADSIVCHLREDRRHINDVDVIKIRKAIKGRLTLELALDNKIIKFATNIKPDHAMFVPEKRQEITTEGGLNIKKNMFKLEKAIAILKKNKIIVSLFIDPIKTQIKCAQELGSDVIELHTGPYAHAKTANKKLLELNKLDEMAKYGKSLGLSVSAGHGLKYTDVQPVAKIKEIVELNIGHAMISYSVFWGLSKAVKDMKKLLK